MVLKTNTFTQNKWLDKSDINRFIITQISNQYSNCIKNESNFSKELNSRQH